MSNKRSLGKLETKKARNYAFQHSAHTTGTRKNIIEVEETVFVGTPEELEAAVLAELGGERSGLIPEVPQGLILSDSRGAGYFDLLALDVPL